jgi:hypothetical protein
VSPNQANDMHDGTIAQADTWLQTNLGAYATWRKRTTVVDRAVGRRRRQRRQSHARRSSTARMSSPETTEDFSITIRCWRRLSIR